MFFFVLSACATMSNENQDIDPLKCNPWMTKNGPFVPEKIYVFQCSKPNGVVCVKVNELRFKTWEDGLYLAIPGEWDGGHVNSGTDVTATRYGGAHGAQLIYSGDPETKTSEEKPITSFVLSKLFGSSTTPGKYQARIRVWKIEPKFSTGRSPFKKYGCVTMEAILETSSQDSAPLP